MSGDLEQHTANRIRAGHERTGNRRHFADAQFVHRIGVLGEEKVCRALGLPFDLTDRPFGDKGHDVRVGDITIDIKTDSYAGEDLELKVEVGKVRADAYVLVHFDKRTEALRIVGWEYGRYVKAAPTKSYGHVTVNHFIAAERLRPFVELRRKIGRGNL